MMRPGNEKMHFLAKNFHTQLEKQNRSSSLGVRSVILRKPLEKGASYGRVQRRRVVDSIAARLFDDVLDEEEEHQMQKKIARKNRRVTFFIPHDDRIDKDKGHTKGTHTSASGLPHMALTPNTSFGFDEDTKQISLLSFLTVRVETSSTRVQRLHATNSESDSWDDDFTMLDSCIVAPFDSSLLLI